MAKTIENKSMYVDITPYEEQGQTYNVLNVTAGYQKGSGFYVNYHPGWGSARMFGCCFDFSKNPLTSTTWVNVKSATKNSAKEIEQMHANLTTAEDAIKWLFDHREWYKLNAALQNIAMFGYTEAYRKQMAELMSKTVDESPMMKQFRELKAKNSEAVLLFRCGDFYETYEDDAKVCADILGITLTKSTKHDYQMAGFPHHALDTYLPKLVRAGKKVAICDQINENDNENKENKTMTTVKMNNESVNVQNAQVNNEANEAVENVSVGEVSVDDIVPTVVEEVQDSVSAKTEEPKAVTMPLGNHGTLVIGGVPKPKKGTQKPAAPTAQAALSTVRLVTFTTKRGDTAPRIIGFSGEDDPRWKKHYDEKQKLVEAYNKAKKKDPKAKMTSDPFGAAWLTDRVTSEKTYCMTFGTRYMDVAKALCDAYNTNDQAAWAKAEQAVVDCKNGIVAGFAAEKAARKAEREAKREEREAKKKEATVAAKQLKAMPAEEQAMFDLFKKFMAGDKEAMEQVQSVLKKAA